MEVLSVEETGRNGRARVVFGNGTTLVLYRSELKKYGLVEKGIPVKEVEDGVLDSILEDTIRPRCRTRALHLISKMDRTEADLRKRLSEGGYPEDIIEETIAFMREYHYVDDREYARSFVRTYGDSKSIRVLTQKLYEKGISKEDIRAAVEEAYEGDEGALIRRLLEKRHYNPETADRKEKEKTIRYLLGKGFSYDAFSDYV